ncbi:MAG TPA: helix-turn-helix domain-containing protein [Vicinamibacteria bacterium]|nr:helix-turn-helix domain-containing protein [Vicinamibacteria bacterium]
MHIHAKVLTRPGLGAGSESTVLTTNRTGITIPLADALREAEGNQARAARSLGIRYHQLRHYLAKHRLAEES